MATIARTGWTVDSLPDLADGPAMIKELADQVAPDIGAPAFANVASLPSTGNYAGRLAWTSDGAGLYRHSGSAWVRINPARGTAAVTFDGSGVGSLTHNAGFVPSQMFFTPRLGAAGVFVTVTSPLSISSVLVWLRAWLLTTGAVFASGSISSIDWVAYP